MECAIPGIMFCIICVTPGLGYDSRNYISVLQVGRFSEFVTALCLCLCFCHSASVPVSILGITAVITPLSSFAASMAFTVLLLPSSASALPPLPECCLLCHQWQYFQQSPPLALMAIHILCLLSLSLVACSSCLPALPPVICSSSPFDINGKGWLLISPYGFCRCISFLWVTFRSSSAEIVLCCSRVMYETCWQNDLVLIAVSCCSVSYAECLYC